MNSRHIELILVSVPEDGQDNAVCVREVYAGSDDRACFLSWARDQACAFLAEVEKEKVGRYE